MGWVYGTYLSIKIFTEKEWEKGKNNFLIKCNCDVNVFSVEGTRYTKNY
jgi:hypothetical protein